MRRLQYLVVVITCLLAAAVPALAATINVNSTADNLTAADGNCTLREAIRNANTDSDTTGGDCTAGSGTDIINVPAGTYTLTIPPAGPNDILTGDLDITDTDGVTISGAGAATTIIQACTVDQKTANCPGGQGIVDRVFDIQPGATTTITGVTIQNGNSPEGGGIRANGGTLNLENSVIRDNTATNNGGGITSNSRVTLRDSVVSGNTAAANRGGGIDSIGTIGPTELENVTLADNTAGNVGGGISTINPTTITNSTISGNNAPVGGGIASQNTGLTVTNSTVSGNSAISGGGIFRDSIVPANLNNVTITNNTAGNGNGGGIIASTAVNVSNTIIAGNFDLSPGGGTHPDCSGPLTSQGFNLIGDGAGCTGVTDGVNGDHVGTAADPIDPGLGPLQNNGGPTDTHGLFIGSPAVDGGNDATCEASDQRGVARPVGPHCDIGAFEGAVARPLDHFLCYKGKVTTGFQAQGVALEDQFDDGPQTVTVKKPASLCNPVEKTFDGNVEPIKDPNTHLLGYKIKQEALHEPVTGIIVKNQLHPDGLSVDTIKPDRLLVPTAKDLLNPVPEPDPDTHSVDHYKCYKVKVTPGTPKFPKGIQASLVDQFDQPKLFDIKKPRRLCNPVDKDGEGIKNEAAHLMCYQAKPAKDEPKHVKILGIHVNNQFGPEQLDTIKEEEFCVPSEKTVGG